MPIPMDSAAQQRALRAISLMVQQGYGIMRAADMANSSRRSVHKYMKYAGLKFKIAKGKMEIVRTMEQKIYEFVRNMSNGDSATKAARKAHTTVKTMSRKELSGSPIILKEGAKWKLNVFPLYNHSLVLYGHILGMGDNIQGQYEEDGEIKSPDAPSIWWQIDFDEFFSTLPDTEVGEFWSPIIVEWLQSELQTPLVLDDTLAERFMSNNDVMENIEALGRIEDGELKISTLEKLMSRYDVKLHEYVNYGINDNHLERDYGWLSADDLGVMVSLGKFQIFIVDDEENTYPKDGPMEMDFEYDLREERE